MKEKNIVKIMKIKTHKVNNELNYTKIKQSDKYRMWSIPEDNVPGIFKNFSV